MKQPFSAGDIHDLTWVSDARITLWEGPSPAARMSALTYTVEPPRVYPDPVEQFGSLFALGCRPYSRCEIWVTNVLRDNAGELPPGVTLQLRGGPGVDPKIATPVTTVLATVPLVIPAFGAGELAFVWAGLPMTQFELWGFSSAGLGAIRSVRLTFCAVLNVAGCCDPQVHPGPWEAP